MNQQYSQIEIYQFPLKYGAALGSQSKTHNINFTLAKLTEAFYAILTHRRNGKYKIKNIL